MPVYQATLLIQPEVSKVILVASPFGYPITLYWETQFSVIACYIYFVVQTVYIPFKVLILCISATVSTVNLF